MEEEGAEYHDNMLPVTDGQVDGRGRRRLSWPHAPEEGADYHDHMLPVTDG